MPSPTPVSPEAASPLDAYLVQLAPASRRAMRNSIQTIAAALSHGELPACDFPWSSSTYSDAVRLLAWLERGCSPATAAHHLCAFRCVLREAWRLD